MTINQTGSFVFMEPHGMKAAIVNYCEVHRFIQILTTNLFSEKFETFFLYNYKRDVYACFIPTPLLKFIARIITMYRSTPIS